MKTAVIGAGSWGIALAKLLHTNGHQVAVWSALEDEIKMLNENHEHLVISKLAASAKTPKSLLWRFLPFLCVIPQRH